MAGTVKPLAPGSARRAPARNRGRGWSTVGADDDRGRGRVHARGRPARALPRADRARRRGSPRASRARSSCGEAASCSCSSRAALLAPQAEAARYAVGVASLGRPAALCAPRSRAPRAWRRSPRSSSSGRLQPRLARPSRRGLRRAARHPPAGVRPERRAGRRSSGTWTPTGRSTSGTTPTLAAAGPRRRDRLRHRRRPSRLRRQDRRGEVVRRRLCPRRRGRPRHVRRRSDRGGRQQHGRDRRRRLVGRAARREGGRRQRPDRRRGRGQGDPLGGRARRAA